MTQQALVVGGKIEGVQAALDIANSGIEVTLIEKLSSLSVEGEDSVFLRPKLLEAANHSNIKILLGSEVTGVSGKKGSFKVTVSQSPRYVIPDACVSCGRCEQACPCSILDPISGELHKAIHYPAAGLKSVPSTCIIDKEGVAPCVAACPAGTNVQGYVALISKGKFKEALELVREALPFPHILGRVCTHPCENACTRGKVDQPIAIASLKRFLADSEASAYGLGYTDDVMVSGPSRVAIIGSGPAGLTCARDLARMGYKSTIFEALPVPGGMVAVGMPRFRLPREVRETEIEAIYKIGVEIRMNTPVGKDLTLDDLKNQGYEAIFVAIGAHRNLTLDIPGEDLGGVLDAITLLREVNLIRDFNVKQLAEIRKNVVIIGGGYTAIDTARTAIRLGCEKVTILYRRTANEMMATKAEILETTEEGVDIQYLVAPVRIVGKDGKVVGVECQRMKLGEIDHTGRRSPVPIEGSEFLIEADTVIPAIGQYPDFELLDTENMGLHTEGMAIVVDPLTLATNLPGVFAGGDAVYGPRSMVEAVGDGRRAAVSIDRFLRGEDISVGRTLRKLKSVEPNISQTKIPPGKRRRIPVLPLKQRKRNFEEVETGYTNFMALREAKRCLSCGGCSECMECVRACELEAIYHDMKPVEIELEAGALVFATETEVKLPENVYVIDSNLSNNLLNAHAVAANVITDLAEHREIRKPVVTEPISPVTTPKIGVFICKCGGNVSDVLDVPELLVHCAEHPDTVFAHQISYACSDEGAYEVRNLAKMHGLTHIVLASCVCCDLDQICFSCSDRRIECKNKLLGAGDGLCYDFVNIREHCAWVNFKEPQQALLKAKALIDSSVARVKEKRFSSRESHTVVKCTFFVGGGLAAMQAAADLGAQGFAATVLRFGDLPSGKVVNRILDQCLERGVRVLDDSKLEDVQGIAGDFIVTVNLGGGKPIPFNVGAVVVDLNITENIELPEILEKALRGQRIPNQISSRIPGVFLCECGSDIEESLLRGDAVAGRVSAFLNRGEVQLVQTITEVDPLVCRGCGTCVEVCKFGAPSLIEQETGVYVSKISEIICRGCGTCVAHCPSGAINQDGLNDDQITTSMEAMLSLF